MQYAHLFVIVLLSMFLVECIHTAPHKQGARVSDLKPLFRDDAFVLNESNDEQQVGSIDIISKYFKAPFTLTLCPERALDSHTFVFVYMREFGYYIFFGA